MDKPCLYISKTNIRYIKPFRLYSWNLGLKLQKLNDELSLENGLEIITELANDKYETDNNKLNDIFDNNSIDKDPSFTNIGELQMYKSNRLSKKKLMTDIMLTAKESKDFNEYEKKMNEKGYTLIKQAKSIKYIDNTIFPVDRKKDIFSGDRKIEQVSNFEQVSKIPVDRNGISPKNQAFNQIRDTRLGKQYTKEAIEHYFLNKEQNEFI